MKIAKRIIEDTLLMSGDAVKSALNQRIRDLGLEGVWVEDAAPDSDGDTIVLFVDEDNGEMEVLFTYDDEDGAEAIILPGDEINDDDELELIDLDALEPKYIQNNGSDHALDLINNKWITKSALLSILGAGDLLDDSDEEGEQVDEARRAIVIRNGKRVKVTFARRKKKKRLSAKQKIAIRKGVRTRKKQKFKIARKRKKSLRVRKRMGLRKTKGRSKLLIKA